MQVPVYSVLAVGCAAALPFAALAGVSGTGDYPRLERVLCSQFLRTCGKYSYGIYVLHPFVIERVDSFAKSATAQGVIGTSYEAYALTRTLLGVSGVFALAFLSWHLYEKHFLRLKAFFPSGRASAVSAAAPTTATSPVVPAAVPSP